jgi:PhnB protein
MVVASLTFDGNAEEAFNFYKSAFGGEFTSIQRFDQMPQVGQMEEADKQKIMHISLDAPGGVRLMGNDYVPFSGKPYQAGNNFTLALLPESEEIADRIFNALTPGGNITMPMGRVFWGAYFGMFTDKFGIQWMINCQS